MNTKIQMIDQVPAGDKGSEIPTTPPEQLKVTERPQSERQTARDTNRLMSEVNEKNNFLNAVSQSTKYVKADMELIWKNLVIETKEKKKGKNQVAEKKRILHGISGCVKSGECLAIIGSSGAGKTTLLNYLSRKTESQTLDVSGDVKLNGQQIDNEKFSLIASYVMQDDILEATMTPLEILLFTAKLKLALPLKEVETRVREMIIDLNLTRCKDTRIGDALIRGVSGGERKRTSIAVELISDPKIIFLDEPTTGLDSFNAYEVIDLLNSLARKGKMVIFTIHQPSSEIFHLLSKLCILALGKTVYFGPHDKSLNFFEELKIPVPMNYNPFEHFMEVTNVSIVSNDIVINEFRNVLDIGSPKLEKGEVEINTNDHLIKYDKLMTHFSQQFTQNCKKYDYSDEETISNFSEDNKTLFESRNVSTNFFYQFSMLFGRNIVISQRNKKIFFLRLVQSMFPAFFVSILFARLSKNFSGIQDRLGVILMSLTNSILNSSISTVLVCNILLKLVSDEQKVFMRERSNKLYSVAAYFFAKIFSELPIYFITAVLFGLLVFNSVDFNYTYSYKYYVYRKKFCNLVGIYVLSCFGGSSWGFFLGSLSRQPETLINLTSVYYF